MSNVLAPLTLAVALEQGEPLGVFCCLILPGMVFLLLWIQLYRLRRILFFQCPVCGQTFSRSDADAPARTCPTCAARGRIETLSREQRDSLRRPATAPGSTQVQEAPKVQRDLPPEEGARDTSIRP